MAEDTFSRILAGGAARGFYPNSTKKASGWFRQQAQIAALSGESALRQLGAQSTGGIEIGKMYLFRYDPKHKEKLPFYDEFPLIFPFDYAQGGFYGINFHYLPYSYRAKLMDALISLADNKNNPNTRLALSYKILKSTAKLKYYKPCVKHYLNKHVSSRFININASQWDIALFLPLHRFNKASISAVHQHSLGQV